VEEGRPSTTAHGAAALRAAHQLLDVPTIIDDPIAVPLAGSDVAAALRANPAPFQTPERRVLRAFIVARSRYAEDELGRAVARGVSQYAILGAGLDSFAYRNPYPPARLRVFEVDHPATQRWKRTRLADAGIAIPDALVFAPVDFERETLADGLARVGFDRRIPAFFSWLGVTVYLTKAAVMETLGFVASCAAGTTIVFTFVPPTPSRGTTALAERTAEMGEPWLTYFDPAALADDLRRMGFTRVEDVGPAETNRRYFDGRGDGLRVGGLGHLMTAEV